TRALPIRPAPRSSVRVGSGFCLASTLENRRSNGFFRGLSAPEHELESRVIVIAGFNREIEKRFALCRARPRIRKNHRVPEHERTFVGEQVEMTDPEFGVDVHEQGSHLCAACCLNPHFESRREMKRLQILAPGEAKMMIAPAPGYGEIEFVAPAALERPAMVLDRPFQHVERVEVNGRYLLMG